MILGVREELGFSRRHDGPSRVCRCPLIQTKLMKGWQTEARALGWCMRMSWRWMRRVLTVMVRARFSRGVACC